MTNFEDPALLPVGCVLPILEGEEEVPEGWEIIEGQTIYVGDNPDFVNHISQRLLSPLHDPDMENIRVAALEFFQGNGGEVRSKWIKLPTSNAEESSKHMWGDTPFPAGMPNLRLMIKVKRTLTNDG